MASRNRKSNGKASNGNNDVPVANSAPETTTEQRASATGDSMETQSATSVTPNAGILVLKGTNKSGKTAAYTIPGQMGSVRVARSAITNDSFPQSFSDIVFKQVDQARLEKQQAKAARREASAATAEERAKKLEARIAKANAAAEKNAAKLAKLQARLAPKSAQASTEEAAAATGVEPSVPAEGTEASE